MKSKLDIKQMDLTTRRRLVQMACMAAWSDMDIAESERAVVLDLAANLALEEGDMDVVRAWLTRPPPEFDPYDIPRSHRQAFLETFIEVIQADGRIDPEESEAIRLLRELVA